MIYYAFKVFIWGIFSGLMLSAIGLGIVYLLLFYILA